MTGGKVSDDVIDAIAFIEMHRQETEKESGTAAACAQALPKLQELLEQLSAGSAEPPDVHAANIAAVTNDIARVKRFSSGGGHGGGGKHARPGQKKQAPRQHGGHAQGQGGHGQGGHAHGGHAQGGAQGGGPAGGQGHGPNQGRGPNQGQGRRRGRNKRRGGGGGAGGGNAGGGGPGGPRGAE